MRSPRTRSGEPVATSCSAPTRSRRCRRTSARSSRASRTRRTTLRSSSPRPCGRSRTRSTTWTRARVASSRSCGSARSSCPLARSRSSGSTHTVAACSSPSGTRPRGTPPTPGAGTPPSPRTSPSRAAQRARSGCARSRHCRTAWPARSRRASSRTPAHRRTSCPGARPVEKVQPLVKGMSPAQRWTLIAAILGSGIVFLDSTVVNVALPRMGRELPSGIFGVLEGQSYVYNGYLLTVSALLILAGALNDFYGRKRMFVIGLSGFLATSVLCGIAPNLELLVLFRVLQGIAGALLVPGSLALITVTFSGEVRGRAFGLWAAASAATTILGPFVGGVLVDTVSWRAVFFLNVPLLFVAIWATWTYVEESRAEGASSRFDWLGAFVVALPVGRPGVGAIHGQQRELQGPPRLLMPRRRADPAGR